MATTRMRHAGVAVLVGLVLLASACSGGDEAATTSDGDGADVGSHAVEDDAAPEATDAAPEAAADGEADGDALALGVSLDLGRQVIRTAMIELRFDDPRAAVRDITRLVERSGGFVAGADLRQADRVTGAGPEPPPDEGTMTLRVPADELTGTLAALEDLAAEVVSRSVDSEDVTEQYADVEAQLRNLRAFEAQLLELLEQVEEQDPEAGELITVFERIRGVREQIEQLQGRKQVLDDRIALATIDVRLGPARDPVTATATDWRPATVITDALATTVGTLQVVANVAIWLTLTALPVAAVVLGPIGLAMWALRRRRAVPSEHAG